MYVTRATLTAWRTAAGLQPADEGLAAKIEPLVDAINSAEFNGRVNETIPAQRARLAALVVVSEADLVKVVALAVAAGALVHL